MASSRISLAWESRSAVTSVMAPINSRDPSAAEATLISSRAKAEATKIEAEADAARYQVEADGQEAINAARNVLDDRLIALELKKALIEVMPEVLEAAMKPVEKIKDIRIIDMGQGAITGLNAPGNGGNGKGLPGVPGVPGGGTLPDNIVQALMAYRMQAPLVDELLSELGFEPKEGLGGMLPNLSAAAAPPAKTNGAAKTAGAAAPYGRAKTRKTKKDGEAS